MPSDTGKAPAFGGAGRGRLPMGKLRGHSPGWWKTPRAAGPSESAASTRSEGKGPKAGQFLTQPPYAYGTSIGVSFYPLSGTFDEALHMADTALYSSKRSGKGTFTCLPSHAEWL